VSGNQPFEIYIVQFLDGDCISEWLDICNSAISVYQDTMMHSIVYLFVWSGSVLLALKMFLNLNAIKTCKNI
jgi:hypothetical protein